MSGFITNAELRIEAERLCDENDQLAAENAKLRERVEKLEELLPENGRWFSTEVVEAYIAEIEKLRELVRDMYEMAYPEYPSAFEAAFADRMRELGIEVD